MSKMETVAPEREMGLLKALRRLRGGAEADTPPRPISRVRSESGMGRGRTERERSRLRKSVERDAKAALTDEIWPLPGLAPMTRVRTEFGDVHAIALRQGDKVLTRSGEYKPIVWLNRMLLDADFLAQKPDSHPIEISANALGASAPAHNIMISPRQVICGSRASGKSEKREAAMLLSRPGIRRYHESGMSYTLFHVGESADIFCEGLYLHFALSG